MSIKVTVRDAASVPRATVVPNPNLKGPSFIKGPSRTYCPVSEADIRVADHGSTVLLHPQTDAAKAWIARNVDNRARFFGVGLAVEPQHVDGIIEGMTRDGLEVE